MRASSSLRLVGGGSGCDKALDFPNYRGSFRGEVVFPDAEHTPSLAAQCFGDNAIAERVGRKFFLPEWTVVHRQIGVFGAPMPKTPINEDNNTLPAKSEIWFAKMSLASSPAGDAMRPKKFGKGKFGVLVSVPANAGHDLRAFFYGENVRHCA